MRVLGRSAPWRCRSRGLSRLGARRSAARGCARRIGNSTVVLVDAARRRVIRTISIERSGFGAAAFPGGLVVLLGDSAGNEPVEVAVTRRRGALRTVTVDQISAGYTDYGDGHIEVRRPGLAVDAAAHRAFVVDADFTVAEIDLNGFALAYHGGRALARSRSASGPVRGRPLARQRRPPRCGGAGPLRRRRAPVRPTADRHARLEHAGRRPEA